MTTTYISIPLDELKRGVRLSAAIFDADEETDVLLLNKGIVLTPATIERLRQRGVTNVRIDARHAASLRGKNAKPLPVTPGTAPPRAAGAFAGRLLPDDALAHRVNRSWGVPASPEQVEQFTDSVRAAEAHVGAIFQSVTTGDGVPGPQVRHFADDALGQLMGDFDLFVRLGLNVEDSTESRSLHGVRVARLAMAAGTVSGLTRLKVLHLGMGCLIADAGMSAVDATLCRQPRRLDSIEFLEITKHPARTFDLLVECGDVPSEARLVAYQMHERWNGSGYPRGRTGTQIHPLARLAAVADAFVAMVSERPWRTARPAASAMRQLLVDTQQGLFDPAATRALLETLSLFPVGTRVRLSDGRTGRVVASHVDAWSRPVVELTPVQNQSRGMVIDLAKSPEIEITAALTCGATC